MFELIAVKPDFDEYGDEILVINAIFNAIFNKDLFGSQRTSDLIRHLRPRLWRKRARKRFRFSP